jgi:hypothetical protein
MGGGRLPGTFTGTMTFFGGNGSVGMGTFS